VREKWRLITDPALPGDINMARDMAMLEQVACHGAPPTLRFYAWNPPALSLGYFQKAEDVIDIKACRRLGIDIVRRPTGGRALLHHRELTYSLAVSENHPLIPRDVLSSYRLLSSAIVEGLHRLGVEAEMAPGENRGRGLTPGSCFDTPSAFEIQVRGKKVVGSAQLRRSGVLLQHGSILLELSPDLYRQVLLPSGAGEGDDYLVKLGDRSAGLADLGYRLTAEELALAVCAGFSRLFEADFQ
jgi:lipoate-protein ligase A